MTMMLTDPDRFAQVDSADLAQPELSLPKLAPRRHVAVLELIAGVALVVSTVVAVTVVSIGIARADTLVHWRSDEGSLAIAAWTTLVLVGLSGLSGAIGWLVPRANRALRRS